MAITLTMFRAQVDALLAADDNELTETRRLWQIKAALERYSRERPRIVGENEVGNGGRYYILSGTSAVLASWVDRFSRVLSIEYPAATIASNETPVFLDPKDWDDDYRVGDLVYLYLPNHAPAATETMRIRYTAPYTWSASTVTQAVNRVGHGFLANDFVYTENQGWYKATDERIGTHKVTAVADTSNFTAAILQADPPVGDFFALCWLAAGLCAQAIADRYSRTTDSTISADAVDHLTRAQEWSRRAKELIGMYEEHIGLGEEAADTAGQPAGEFVDWDTAPSRISGSSNWMFH